MSKLDLRKVTYKEGHYYFHMWFQEGGFERYYNGMEGSLDVGAVLENCCNGEVIKVFDIKEIQFLADKG
jgi:hypothetical protein